MAHGQGLAAGFPDLGLLGGVLGNVHFAGVAFLEHLLDGDGVVGNLGRMAVDLDEEDGAGVAGQADLGEVVDAHDGVVVEELEGAGQDVGGDYAGNGLGGALDVVEHGHHGLGGFRRRHELQNGLGDDAEGAFGLHQHAGEVVAGDALDGAGAGFDQGAGGVEELHAHDVVFGHAVFQTAQAASVLGDVAGDGGHGHGARIRGIEEVLGGNGVGQVGRDDAGLDHGVKVVAVDFKDAVEAVGQDDNGVGLVRNGAAGEVGAGTSDGHRHAFAVEAGNAFAELLDVGGTDNEGGNHGPKDGRVKRVGVAVDFGREHVFRAEELLEIFDERLTCHGTSPVDCRWR